jgi:hypothetical protein
MHSKVWHIPKRAPHFSHVAGCSVEQSQCEVHRLKREMPMAIYRHQFVHADDHAARQRSIRLLALSMHTTKGLACLDVPNPQDSVRQTSRVRGVGLGKKQIVVLVEQVGFQKRSNHSIALWITVGHVFNLNVFGLSDRVQAVSC